LPTATGKQQQQHPAQVQVCVRVRFYYSERGGGIYANANAPERKAMRECEENTRKAIYTH